LIGRDLPFLKDKSQGDQVWDPFPRQTIRSFSKPQTANVLPGPKTRVIKHPKIGICGNLHAGKSTLAGMLVDRGYIHQAFAGPLKDFAVTAVNNIWYDKAQRVGSSLGWKEFTLDDLREDKTKFRLLLQFIGQYGRDTFGEDIWIRMFDPPAGMIVVDDVRHHNEVEFLRNLGYHIVRVERDEGERKLSAEQALGRKIKKKEWRDMHRHESEIHVDELDVDEIVYNTSFQSLEDAASELTR
jgi:hypothetical protein